MNNAKIIAEARRLCPSFILESKGYVMTASASHNGVRFESICEFGRAAESERAIERDIVRHFLAWVRERP